MEKWSKCVAIVTGSNSGIGLAVLKKLAEAGVIVVGLDIMTDAIVNFKNEHHKLKVHSLVCDVTSDEETEASFEWVHNLLGGVDILVNNAGCINSVGILEHKKPMSELASNIDLNFTAVVRCSRLAYKSMDSRNTYGYIININSVYGQGLRPVPPGVQIGVYQATKSAITTVTENIRQELIRLSNKRVRVSSVSPGVVKTNIFKAGGLSNKQVECFLADNHLSPDDIANTIIYLLSTPQNVNIHEITVRATGSEL